MELSVSDRLIESSLEFRSVFDDIQFEKPVTYIYNPLKYAWLPFKAYLRRYGDSKKRVVFLGMNPGPWGMAQTGIPFGEIAAVRDWMGIEKKVYPPENQHPKRQVLGFNCRRSEISGKRLWGLIRERYGRPELFFRDQFVSNYCPLLFFDENGRNLTPMRLNKKNQNQLSICCDRYLKAIIEIQEPAWMIGVGKYSEQRIRMVCRSMDYNSPEITGILHPSPANPQANRGWKEKVSRQLVDKGIWE